MSPRTPTGTVNGSAQSSVSRRRLLAAGGVLAVGAFAGCLDRVASTVTNTGSSPAAVFAGTQAASVGEFVVGGPHVSRLTPTVSAGQLGDLELEGWVTSSPVMAQNHNSSRSNRSNAFAGVASDNDADGDGVGDGTEDDGELASIHDYLRGEAMVAERFTICLPDAEVPGGNTSIREAVTPERLIAYLTAGDGGRLLSTAASKSRDGGGDCDDDDPDVYPGAVCGTTPHFVAEVSGPTATGGSLEVVRSESGTVTVLNTPPTAEDAPAKVCVASDDDPCGPGVWARATESGSSTGVSVSQVLVQPPRCPRPFPALLYAQRCEGNDQLVYTGGWVIDDAALYEDSMTMLSIADPTEVVSVGLADLGGSFEDVAGGAADWDWPRAQRGARLDSGTVKELVETPVLSEQGSDVLVRKKPGREAGDEDEVTLVVTGDEYGFVTHVAVDAPVLHLTSASRASQDVKFKAGAELSKAVN